MMMVVHNSCEPFLFSGILGPFPVEDNEVWSLAKTILLFQIVLLRELDSNYGI
jgi:hypothetical protein